MPLLNIVYKTKTADVQDIQQYLALCKDNFIPALDKTVDIPGYAKKIAENSVTFEAWVNNELAGLVAAYFNDEKKQKGFITSVGVKKEYWGIGIAARLLKNCITYAAERRFKDISLEVNRENIHAIKLYEKYDFKQSSLKADLIVMQKIL